jgi:predicted dehydrogenase
MDEALIGEWALNYGPMMPRDRSRGIGIVGAGEIVRAAHLPAYRMADFNVVGIYDLNPTRARQVAADFHIPHTFSTLNDLVNCPDIEIVDIAVPSNQLRPIVEAVVHRRKHVLCQKPLGHTYEEALGIYDVCRTENIKAAVNQQMRWAPGIQASHDIMQRGWLGNPTQMTIQVNVRTPWDHWPWMTAIKGMEFLYHSIHYMDAIRYLVGEPDYIFADAAKFPGQPWPAETRTAIVMRFAGELRGLIHDNHNNFAPDNDWYATFRFEGTQGIIKGTNGALYDYPVGRGDTLSFLTTKIRQDTWITPELKGRWFPHAFMGSMGELMRSIEEDREPVNSVRDNLKTLKMVFAAMRSVDETRPVWLSEID